VVVVVVGAAVVVVVVVFSKEIFKALEHKALTLLTFTIVVPSGTKAEEYPANKLALLTPLSKADVYPSKSEYKSKGPESYPAVVNVINTVIGLFLNSCRCCCCWG